MEGKRHLTVIRTSIKKPFKIMTSTNNKKTLFPMMEFLTLLLLETHNSSILTKTPFFLTFRNMVSNLYYIIMPSFRMNSNQCNPLLLRTLLRMK